MATAVVVDTMIASAWLGLRASERKARWQPLLERSAWVLPFTVVAEMRFGAEVACWGERRRGVLDRLVARAGVVPPFDAVSDAYVEAPAGDRGLNLRRGDRATSRGPRGSMTLDVVGPPATGELVQCGLQKPGPTRPRAE